MQLPGSHASDRRRLRAIFDQDAALYDAARPGYPEALFDDLVALSGIPPGGRILEVGCGTGQATLPLARRGYEILCVELGANLAAMARERLADSPRVSVWTGAFEAWPADEASFDLVVAANAFHWIDPALGYPKAAAALRPGGSVALFWQRHVHTNEDPGFFSAVTAVYRREAPEIVREPAAPTWAHEQPATVAHEIADTGLFGPVAIRRYRWDVEYDARSYTRLLETYSEHRALPPTRREGLLRGIAELIQARFGGRITKGYLADLYVAARR